MPDEIHVLSDTDEGAREANEDQTAIHEPGKLLRIALMLRGMQEEVRRAGADEAGRERLRVVHDRALGALRSVLSDDLQEELADLTLPFEDEVPTESEILISQAQLIGWLEGLFQGIQAAIAQQQFMARHQLEQMRQRGLPTGQVSGPGGQKAGPGQGPETFGPGSYL